MAGQAVLVPPFPAVGGGEFGGTQPPDGSVQLHWHGGQVVPGAQLGQAQPHPCGTALWHTPETHGCPAAHGTPSAYHWHFSVGSPAQELWSVNWLHGSDPFGAGAPVPPLGAVPPPALGVPVVVPSGAGTAPPVPQPHAQGAQVWPGAQVGHAQVQVPLSTQPLPVPPFGSHLQSQGGHASPGAQAGHAQVQVPPPPPPEPPPEQSHSGGGHFPPAGQTSGVTQPHGPPFASSGWQ